MWQNNAVSRARMAIFNNWEPPSAGGDVLPILTELNELCLELLAEQALQAVPPTPPMSGSSWTYGVNLIELHGGARPPVHTADRRGFLRSLSMAGAQ